jgi:uncharacterized protein YdaT
LWYRPIEATEPTEIPIVVQSIMDGNKNDSPIEVQDYEDHVGQFHDATIEKQNCYLHFEQEHQDISNQDIYSHYHDIHSALLANFSSNIEYAIKRLYDGLI